MKILDKKEGGFYNNKILVIFVLMLMLIGVVWFVFADANSVPIVLFNSPSANNTYTNDNTTFFNISFTASNSAGGNMTIVNSSINVTINDVVYNASVMSCVYSNPASINETITCNFSTQTLPSGTYNITAKAKDNASNTTGNAGVITHVLYNLTVYTGQPSIFSVTLSDPSPTKAGNVTFNITFDRLMNTNSTPLIRLTLGNGSEIGEVGTAGWNESTFGLYTMYNLSYTNDTINRRSTWVGYFVFNGSSETASIFDGTTYINVTQAQDMYETIMDANGTNSFVFDSTNPYVTLGTRNETNQTTVSLSFNFTDNLSATATCKLHINATANVTGISANNNTATTQSISDTSAEGAFSWIVECNDTAGNFQNASTTFLVYVDQTVPVFDASKASPLDGHYVKDDGDVTVSVNITDAFTGIENQTTSINMTVYGLSGTATQTFTTSSSTPLDVSGPSKTSYVVTLNISKYIGVIPENTAIVYNITYTDFAGNKQTNSTTIYIDNTAPTHTAPTPNGSTYAQGDNLSFSITVTEAGAGVNNSIGGFTINTTTITGIAATALTCTGSKPTYTCTFNYNTSSLQAGSLRLTGYVNTSDNTDQLRNNVNTSVILDFIITDAGAPVIGVANITTNITRVVKNIETDVQINVTVEDKSGINKVWATYDDNGTSETCIFFSGGVQSDVSIVAIGNCTINATDAGGSVSDNLLTLALYANDTTGAGETVIARYTTLIVEKEAINVTAFSVPLSPYVNQTISINATVFSWYGSPSVQFNVTNSTTGAGVVTLNATCTAADAKARLYYCTNTTNTSVWAIFVGNQSKISVLNATLITTDTTLPAALTATYYTNATAHIGSMPDTSTLTFVGSQVTLAGAAGKGLNATVGSTTQSIQITDTTLNDTVITLNNVNLTAMNNFTLEIIAPNSTNGTNFTTIQASLTTATATLLTSLVIQPKVNYSTTTAFTSTFTGSTIAFNCSGLGITCASTTRVYKASFNTTTNLTTSTWTQLTPAPTLSNSNTILTQTVNSFSIFALATPIVAAATTTTTTSSSGASGSSGGIGYTLVGKKLTAFDIIDMIRDFFEGVSTKTAFDIIDSIRKFYEEGT